MNKQTITRILALILAVILALGCFLLPVLAAETEGLSSYYSSAEFEDRKSTRLNSSHVC